jgi:enamine deaminase RidA (YjgF/YER057c/UK114 family)
MVISSDERKSGHAAGHSFIDLGDSARLVLMLTPTGRGSFRQQATEVLSVMQNLLQSQPQPMTATSQTVFLRDASERTECERLLAAHYGPAQPVTSFVLQPPCGGAALALEVWAIGGPDVRVERFGPQALAVSYDSVRWVYCAGIESAGASEGAYRQMAGALERMRGALVRAGSDFEHVVRTWFYLGGITEPEADTQRYKELNRARTDFYQNIHFCGSLLEPAIPHAVYPASTGIGMGGNGLVASCLTLQTPRKDVFLLPLENPQQTPAYAYHPQYSLQSPKFSRAMALVLGDYVTTWVSGTASIVNAESRHSGDIQKQTEQTIDNIERLISPANLAVHGVKGAGARLDDLAKIRVYLKRPQDFAICKAICERRFGAVPAIYAVADVCRPELLVEIEGVAFSRYAGPHHALSRGMSSAAATRSDGGD